MIRGDCSMVMNKEMDKSNCTKVEIKNSITDLYKIIKGFKVVWKELYEKTRGMQFILTDLKASL